MSAHEHTHDDGHAHSHAHPHDHRKIYLATLLALLLLTIITVGISRIDLGSANVVVALVVASIKATLVGLFFMHLKYDKPINAFIMCTGFFFLGLLLTFTLLDIDNRTDKEPAGLKVAKPVAVAPAAGAAPETAPAAAPHH